MDRSSSRARTRYIEDWELEAALALPSKRKAGSVRAVQAAIRLIMLTPLRRADYPQLGESNLKDDGIHVDTQKTGKPVIYTWTPELRAAIDMAKAARPVDIAPWLFCTRRGECYYQPETGDAPGWDSMVQRFMDRVVKETKVKKRASPCTTCARIADRMLPRWSTHERYLLKPTHA